MNAGEQLLNALGDGKPDPLALVKQQAMMKVQLLRILSPQTCCCLTNLRSGTYALCCPQDNMNFHFRIVRGCFENCCKPPFKTKRISRDENHCIETCFGKMM
jgi:hypothetical protein